MLAAEQAAAAAAAAKAGSGGGSVPVGGELREPYLEEQVARLKSTKRLLLAMQVAAALHDEMMVNEGAIRVYHLLGPLLALKHKTPLLHKALASVHLGLQVRG